MKVFVSWSGKRSHHIATALRDWLPNVLQPVRPFISSQDILKGARGNVQITKELEEAVVGVICLTNENLTAPWILFEAGALSKLTSAYVCTYLYDLEPSDIAPPLGQFQHTRSTKKETFALVQTINAELPEASRLGADRLRDAFEIWWSKLETKLSEVPPKPEEEESPPERTEQDKIDELLELVRRLGSNSSNRKNDIVVQLGRAIFHGHSVVPAENAKWFECTIDMQKLPDAAVVEFMAAVVDINGVENSHIFDLRRMQVDITGHSLEEARHSLGELRTLAGSHGLDCSVRQTTVVGAQA
ncbi:hypothetical protein [Aporhodopirellula aestuarii]|uniref:TIR domain-containing protein n=1 Tax=Aporhodopirellula aestuarii TaxID=2950107 RepID=A0ABT0U2Z8_9BACT|nr:hypothetical protein [Aporhodopirellula aestuarii]MCM2370945.1 hypothetical protein [Aporhodopirellula aestuarii]